MTKAVSNVDTAFIEDLTAMAIHQKDLCEMLGGIVDTPDALQLLGNIYQQAEKIRLRAIQQREHIKQRRTP